MLVKFFRHGAGSGAGPLNYLLGSDRQRADAKVLYGDPVMTEQLINATQFKQKYKSGVLSFTEQADQFTDKQKMDIMQRFEKTLFAGLDPDQYDILWIEHSDKDKKYELDEDGKIIEGSETRGRLELNFIIPCQELRSGKSLQPFYAGSDLIRVNAFKNIINQEYGLTDPDEPKRKRLTNTYVNNALRPLPSDNKTTPTKDKDDEIIIDPPDTHSLKEAIDRKMLHSLKEGGLSNRNSVLYLLKSLGLKVTKTTKKSISVAHPNIKRNLRLKGDIYKEDFQALKQRPYIIDDLQQKYDRTQEFRRNQDLIVWNKGMEIKRMYYQKIYDNVKAPEPLELDTQPVLADSKITKQDILKPQSSYSPSP